MRTDTSLVLSEEIAQLMDFVPLCLLDDAERFALKQAIDRASSTADLSPVQQGWIRLARRQAGATVKGGEGSGYFDHAGIPGHRGGSAPDGIGTLTGGPAATAAVHAQGQAPTHGLTLPTVNLRNRPAVHKQLDSFMAASPALSKLASTRTPLPKAALTPIPEKHLGEVMRATGVDSKLPTKQNLAIGAKSLFMPVAGQDELDAYMEQRLKEKGPRSAAGSGGKGSFFKPSPAKGANAHAQLKKDAKVADGKKLEKTRKKTREETRGLLLSAVEEAARTGNWQNANALQIKYELTGGVETFALLMGYQAVDGGTETGILVLDRSALAVNPTPIVGVTPTPPGGNAPTPLPRPVPALGRGRLQTPLPRGGAITKGGTGSGNFRHRGIPGHRGGSAPNGGADSSADGAALVDIMTAGWSAPDFAYLDREADWVKDLTAKRDAFLAEARTLPKLAPLRERYVGLVQTLQAVEHPEQYPQWVQNLKKAEQDYEQALQDRRDLFVKHFGNETAQRLGYSPLTPDLKGTPVAQEIKTGQTFLNQTVANWPTKGTGKKKLLRYDVYYSTQRAHYAGGSVVLAHSDKANTVVHETGHFLEAEGKTRDGIPYHHVALNFLEARTAGEYPKSLKLLTGNAYGDGELARPDKFLHPYIGREYPDGKATEVLSMGMEFLYSNPVKFASADEEHFYLTVGMLQGVIAERPRAMKGGTGSGNFSHRGIPGHRGGSAPNGGPHPEGAGGADHAGLVAEMVGDAPIPEWKRALDRLNATGWAAPPPDAPKEGGTLWNPQAAAVKRLEKKRKAFLKELDQASPSLTDLRARFDELARRSAFMNRKDPLTDAEKKEWYAMIQDRVIEKKMAADRALLLKHFGNKTPTRPPLPDVKLNDRPFQENYSASQDFLSRLLNDTPRDGDGIVMRPQVTVQPGIRSYFKESEDRMYLTDQVGNAAVHEYGHWLEKNGYTEAGVDYATLANDYLNGRTKGSKSVSLAALAQDAGYEGREYTRPDHFLSPYTGKVYSNGATEITSTGLGYLFSDPGGFARGDADHFLFTLHLLQGGNK